MNRDLPGTRLVVVLPERVGVRRERPLGELEHLLEHGLDSERAEEGRGRLQQQPEPSDLLGVEALVVFEKSAFDVLSRQKRTPHGLGEPSDFTPRRPDFLIRHDEPTDFRASSRLHRG